MQLIKVNLLCLSGTQISQMQLFDQAKILSKEEERDLHIAKNIETKGKYTDFFETDMFSLTFSQTKHRIKSRLGARK